MSNDKPKMIKITGRTHKEFLTLQAVESGSQQRRLTQDDFLMVLLLDYRRNK